MPLVTVDNNEIYAISISQSEGMLAPAITAKIMPNLADHSAAYFDYEAPDITVSIAGGVTYECAPQRVAVDIDLEGVGTDIEVQYYPKQLRTLRNGGLKKSLVFVSCLPYQQELLLGEYDEELFEVLFKDCDRFVSNGWTVQEILAEIGTRSGVTITALFPTFHVPQTTIVFQRGTNFLDFAKGLLPQGFLYAWNVNDTDISVSLIQSSHNAPITFVPGISRMGVQKDALPPYDFIEITGGVYKYGHIIDFGEASYQSATSFPDGKIVIQTFPPQVKSTENGTETTSVTEQYTTGPDGTDKFAVNQRTTTVNGPFPTRYGTMINTLTRTTTEIFSYENNRPIDYQAPRQTQVSATTSQYYTVLTGTQLDTIQSYWLTDDGRVLTPTEFNAIPSGSRPNFLLCAYQVYGSAETYQEAWAYVQESDADHNWLEGMQKSNAITIRHKFCKVDDFYYDGMMPPKELLQQALSDIITVSEEISVTSYSSGIWKEFSTTTRTYAVLNDGAFQFEESVRAYDMKAGGPVEQPVQRQTIDSGQVPINPTKVRTKPLKITLDTIDSEGGFRSSENGLGGNDVCYPLYMSIPTNNPDDFEAWAGILFEQRLNEQRDVSMQSFDRLFPMGANVGGVTLKNFTITHTKDEGESVTMGGIA